MACEKEYSFSYVLDTGCFLIKRIPIRNNSVIGLTISILGANPTESKSLWKKMHKCYQYINYKIVEIEGTDNLEFGKIKNFEVFCSTYYSEILISVKNPGPNFLLINGSIKVELLKWN